MSSVKKKDVPDHIYIAMYIITDQRQIGVYVSLYTGIDLTIRLKQNPKRPIPTQNPLLYKSMINSCRHGPLLPVPRA